MISRSLGPGFGGAIGLMFTVANSIGVSMYIVGFCESFRDMMFQYVDGFDGFIGGQYSDIRLIGSVTLVVLLAVTLVGMEWITRLQKLLLVLLIAAQVDFMVGTFLPPTTGLDVEFINQCILQSANLRGKIQRFCWMEYNCGV